MTGNTTLPPRVTWLVTGGAGFIGANFVHEVRERTNTRVVNLDKLTYAGNPASLQALAEDPNYVFVHGDISDQVLVADLLRAYRPQAIVHFAAESHVDRSIVGPAAFLETNVVGTFRLLQMALAHWQELLAEQKAEFRFLHVSTDEVYGSLGPDDPSFTEKHAYEPNSPYAASKASSDHFVRAFHHTYGLPTLITNCSNNYGPFQFPEKLIALMIQNALAGKRLPVYGDGQQVRDWLYVRDHCKALCRVLEQGKPGLTYNIGGRAERTNLEVVQRICAYLDRVLPDSPHKPHASLIAFVTDRPGHDRRYSIDISKVERELGWRPAESFESGLEKTIRWYLEHQDWVESVRSGEYQRWMETNYRDRLGGNP